MQTARTYLIRSLKNPILNASGCWCTSHQELLALNASKSGGIVTKSFTLKPRKGNEEPRFWNNNLGTINSTGLANHGYRYYVDPKLITKLTKPLLLSHAVLDVDDTIAVLDDFEHNLTNNITIELNISCPNVEEDIMGYNMGKLEDFLRSLRSHPFTFGLKLPPYLLPKDLKQTANLLLEYRDVVSFVTSINGLPNGLFIENNQPVIKPNDGLGGVGGRYCKPIAVSNVYQFKKLFKDEIDIIGCGGIFTKSDVDDYLSVGAKAVQVGSALMINGPRIFERLLAEEPKIKEYTFIVCK